MLLVPFVEFDDDEKRVGTYTGLYNFDPSLTLTIEPTKDGDTCIVSKINNVSVTLAIPIEKFLAYILKKQSEVDLFFLDDVKLQDKGIMQVFTDLGVIITSK